MNDHHDEHLDPLLAEALGPDEPRAELIDRICDLTDGKLNAALDRALGPHSVSCGHDELVQRILAATSERPAVAGRIGTGSPWRSVVRIAAMVALAVGAYVVVTAVMTPAPTLQDQVATDDLPAKTADSALDAMEYEFASLTGSTSSPFDQRIALVSTGVDQMRGDAVWAESPDVLIDRAAERADWYDDSEGAQVPMWF